MTKWHERWRGRPAHELRGRPVRESAGRPALEPQVSPARGGSISRAVATILVIGAIISAVATFSHPGEVCLAAYTTSLAGRTKSQRHNSELSLGKISGVTIAPGATFSFNKVVGSFSRDEGYRRAPVSYNGQLIESWGGGVCQTSTTLYNAALLSGMEIVERSRHRFQPSYVPPGRDAAVAFSAIDLKFKNPHPYPVRIIGSIDGSRLNIGIYGPHALKEKPIVTQQVREMLQPGTYTIGTNHGRARIRNTGRAGFQVAVYRITGTLKEVISMDSYPSMDRVIQYR